MPRQPEHRERSKLAPKLRMYCNGSAVVNAIRAERAPALAVCGKELLRDVATHRDPEQRSTSWRALRGRASRGSLKSTGITGSASVNVIIRLVEGTDTLPAPIRDHPFTWRFNLVTACVPLSALAAIEEDDGVEFIEIGEGIKFTPPADVSAGARTPTAGERRVASAADHEFGAGVLIGIVDVQGFDFSHPDFLAEGGRETRFVRIWDQGRADDDPRKRPAPAGFGYGAEITDAHMNAALAGSGSFGLPAHLLEPQSQMAVSSHGTHVAGIVAGNRGICRRSPVAAVLLSLPGEDMDRRGSFYDSTRIAHAVDYLFGLGEQMNLPVSINVSLGTNGHAHDASSTINRWIDSQLARGGRSVCVAAGNAGQEAAEQPGDFGYIMGRIHSSGRLPNANLTRNLEWIVVGDGIADLSENEMEIWYSPQDRFAIEIVSPDGERIGPVEPGELVENQKLGSGTFVSIYNELYHPANGDNYAAIYLSPFFSDQGVVGVRGGTWTVRIHSREVRDGRFHAWIERDDPRRFGPVGGREGWSFPSFFSAASNVDNSSVSTLACGQNIISVANLDSDRERINITSSQGPTRDGRSKPEICAPGTDIVSANGFAGADALWVSMSGTSMASPYVAGVAGLMLSADRRLTAAQIAGIMRRTAVPLPGDDFSWRDDAGFGRIGPDACLAEVAQVYKLTDITKT